MKAFERPGHAIAVLLAVLIATAAFAQGPASTIVLNLDATQAARNFFHAQMTIPVKPGPLTLYYPKWIPGEHGPTGPVQNLTGLKFTANGQELPWRRDLLDGWTFHVEVPQGVASIQASLDFIAPSSRSGQGIYTGGASSTDKLAVISWNTVLLYPAGPPSDQLQYQASLRLPAGWKFGTPLPIASQSGDEIKFSPVSLTTLVDSTVIGGEYLRVEPLADHPRVEMDIASDSPAALDVPPAVLEPYKRLVEQAGKLFGAHHYGEYHFLYTLSEHVAHFGLEHHQANDSRIGERGLVDPTERLAAIGLLPHEYVHSWNGKYRRPAGLATPDYEKPMQTDMLWVYEGLTSYLGDVLTARSGLRTPAQARDDLAMIAAELDHMPGRSWRNLQDTADGVPAMQGAPRQWETWRRGLDYYDEDVLNWLWVDTILRQQTQGQRSMDDFCKLFHGGQSGPPAVKTYTFDDVVNTLNQVAPYDWRKFWTERLTNHGPGAPLGGIEGSGWKLVYDDQPSEVWKARAEGKGMNAAYSIGLLIGSEGRIAEAIAGMPAAKAGISPGMTLIAVNGRKYSPQVLRDALKQAKSASASLELLMENSDYYHAYKLDYHEGEKFPHLVRDESKPDMLSQIMSPR